MRPNDICGCHIDGMGGKEVLIRTVVVDDLTIKSEFIMTKDEFLLAYNTWIRGNEE